VSVNTINNFDLDQFFIFCDIYCRTNIAEFWVTRPGVSHVLVFASDQGVDQLEYCCSKNFGNHSLLMKRCYSFPSWSRRSLFL